MKDNFSHVAHNYARYRPHYPGEAFEHIYSLLSSFENAWDCGTGNGQIAAELAKNFKKVIATDISERQIVHARKKENIIYKLLPAEKADFPDNYFDLITVGQAIHWFNFNPFYEKVNRSLRSNGLFAVLGYRLVTINKEFDAIIQYLYHDILGDYWDPERKYIEENYRTIPFPFEEIDAPQYTHQVAWSLEDFINYLGTWSALKHYKKRNKQNPLEEIKHELAGKWDGKMTVSFPILFRLGRKN